MRRLIYIAGLISCLILAGCQSDRLKTDEDKVVEELDPTRNKQETTDPELDYRLGFVNYTEDQFKDESISDHNISIDRNELADSIARIILSQQGFTEIATLVTDKEVLIAYDTENTLDADEAAKIARESAQSILPPFFDVHVTNNTSLIPDIKSLHNSTTKNKNYNPIIKHIISEMKKSPQG